MVAMARQGSETLTDRAYDRILSMIGDGKLKQAEIISHRSLAETLKISKQPICIALQKLESDGVVESIPRIGTQIRQITAEDMWGMLQWRISLEVRVVALASEYASDVSLARIAEMAFELDSSIIHFNGDIKSLRQKDMEFHLSLAECAECKRLRQELSKLNIYYMKSVICEAVQVAQADVTPAKIPVSHVKIIEAVKSHDPECASQLMLAHIEGSSDMRRFTEWYKAGCKNSMSGVEKGKF